MSKKGANLTRLQDLFAKYAEIRSSGSELKMGPEGVSQFLEDINLDPLDVIQALLTAPGESPSSCLPYESSGYGILYTE